jgi:hypothetical protein
VRLKVCRNPLLMQNQSSLYSETSIFFSFDHQPRSQTDRLSHNNYARRSPSFRLCLCKNINEFGLYCLGNLYLLAKHRIIRSNSHEIQRVSWKSILHWLAMLGKWNISRKNLYLARMGSLSLQFLIMINI